MTNLVSFWRTKTVERERGEERREEEEEEVEEDGGAKIQKGMETNLDYGFYEIMYEFPCLVG